MFLAPLDFHKWYLLFSVLGKKHTVTYLKMQRPHCLAPDGGMKRQLSNTHTVFDLSWLG